MPPSLQIRAWSHFPILTCIGLFSVLSFLWTIPIYLEQVLSYTWTVLQFHYVTYHIVNLLILILEIKYNLPDTGIHQLDFMESQPRLSWLGYKGITAHFNYCALSFTRKKILLVNGTIHTDMHRHTCAHYINKCSTLIPKEQRWKNINLNPAAHAIRGLFKIHRKRILIRPINWKKWKNIITFSVLQMHVVVS